MLRNPWLEAARTALMCGALAGFIASSFHASVWVQAYIAVSIAVASMAWDARAIMRSYR